jgi:hypothetical protein
VPEDLWIGRLRGALTVRSPEASGIAEQAVRACPGQPELLLLAALAAMAAHQPDRALAFLKRYQKRFVPGKPTTLLTALALAVQGQFSRAWTLLEAEGMETYPAASQWFVGANAMQDWLRERIVEIRLERTRARSRSTGPAAPRPNRITDTSSRMRPAVIALLPSVTGLPRLEAAFTVQLEIANADAIQLEGATDPEWVSVARRIDPARSVRGL